LGHELGVEIVALGPETEQSGLRVGDSCAVEPYLNCGECGACRRGKTNCCERLRVLGVHTDGGMREWITVPVNKLHRSRNAPLEHLALVEMLCIGAHAIRRAELLPGDPVLVVGAGPIGLSTIRFAQLAGAEVAVLEVSEARRTFCAQQLGVDRLVEPSGDVCGQLREQFGGDLPLVVLDATGNANSMQKSFEFVANGGRLTFVGLVQAEIAFHDPEFHRREMTLLSTRNATAEDFATVIAALDEGKIALTPWITHRAAPDTMIDAFSGWLEPAAGVVKAMLEF
jgi:2-desacetyl-2-hydroxyethyl bacteriochlorophyllide A dehydrogenase